MSKNHHKPEDEKKSIFEKIRNKIEPPEQAVKPKRDITMPAFSTNIGIIQPIKIEPTISYIEDKLIILFIENTLEVAQYRTKLEQLTKGIVTNGNVCTINYGSIVKVQKPFGSIFLETNDLLNSSDLGEKSCLYEALIALEKVVNESYMKEKVVKQTTFETEKRRISTIEIIGIGRCFDNTNTSAEVTTKGIESFNNVASNSKIVTKYFCLSEQDFIRPATLGFHSIGAINRSFF